ncbi:hypothetical protein ILUMI_17422 [Ignelater luminosus]|uniref:Uncharacterized protein n=1 Tax=Ignelater luminosus TaxID=2038154 RepID=A0A8K0G7J7_IGNLU|nr:hypothetical protein ILUMI_17422 [Ignelater luminosus]
MSDHKYIYFEVDKPKMTKTQEKTTVSVDWTAFNSEIEWAYRMLGENEKISQETCTARIKRAYKNAIIRGTRGAKRTPYWWNENIQAQRDKCTKDRRKVTRAARNEIFRHNGQLEALKDTYKRAKKHLQRLIQTSKNQHWDEVIKDLENDIWGKGYEIITRGVANVKRSK